MGNRFFPNYKNYRITSRFGKRTVFGTESFHSGVDFIPVDDNGKTCTDYIKAHTGGIVKYAGYDEKDGNYVVIQVDEQTLMCYYHLKDNTVTVKQGDKVVTGQIIGYMGATGRVTGPHCHFSIIVNGVAIDSEPYLDKDYNITAVPETGKETKYYRVQIASYSIKANAVRHAKKMEAQGFPVCIKKYGIHYRVQVGAYSIKTNAIAMLNKMKELGYKGSFINDQGGKDIAYK